MNPDGRTCIDVDECKESPRICNGGECVNSIGSYSCICGLGLLPGADNSSCVGTICSRNFYFSIVNELKKTLHRLITPFTDINECDFKGNDICGNGNCLNNVGSYTCHCENGYSIKSEDNPYCTDEDECTLETHACDKNAICVNNPVCTGVILCRVLWMPI